MLWDVCILVSGLFLLTLCEHLDVVIDQEELFPRTSRFQRIHCFTLHFLEYHFHPSLHDLPPERRQICVIGRGDNNLPEGEGTNIKPAWKCSGPREAEVVFTIIQQKLVPRSICNQNYPQSSKLSQKNCHLDFVLGVETYEDSQGRICISFRLLLCFQLWGVYILILVKCLMKINKQVEGK